MGSSTEAMKVDDLATREVTGPKRGTNALVFVIKATKRITSNNVVRIMMFKVRIKNKVVK